MLENISSTTRLFADNSLVYRIIHSKEDQALPEGDIDKLQKWERDWLMQFNPDKCEVIMITNKRNPQIRKYYIHNTQLQTGKDAKELQSVPTCPGTSMWITLSRRPLQAWTFWKETSMAALQVWKTSATSHWWGLYKNTPPVYWTRTLNTILTNWRWCSKERCGLSKAILIVPVVWQQCRQIFVGKEDAKQVSHALQNCAQLGCYPCYVIPHTSENIQRTYHEILHIPQSTVNSHLYFFFLSTIHKWNQLPEYAVSVTNLETFKQQMRFNTF